MGGTGGMMPTGPRCGNAMVETGEACEANVAMTATCMSLGMGTGTLGCDPTTCMFDMDGCTDDMMGNAGAGGP
jgi:hypothetical protein